MQPMTDGNADGDVITVAAGETKRLEPKTYLTADITLRLAPDADMKSFTSALTKYAKLVGGSKEVLSVVLYGSSSFLKFSDELLPAAVAIDEAIELARRYGSTDSAAFVNGILDQLAHH